MIMNYLKKPYCYIWSVSIGLMILVLLAGFVPQREGNEVRRHISTTFVELTSADLPTPIINDAGWSFRSKANSEIMSVEPILTQEHAKQNAQWINFINNTVKMHTAYGKKSVASNTRFTALNANAGNTLNVATPTSYGEALGVDGKPVRFVNQESLPSSLAAYACLTHEDTFERVQSLLAKRISMRSMRESTSVKINRYKPIVQKAAKRYNLSVSLLLAIIQTESNFSPTLVSSRSAMGLMQLLPSTAGGEVHRYLHGHSANITHEDLSNPELNILFGATYMHLLLTRHLGGVTNEQSRIYCALAAYNMGPGRLVRFFGGRENAIANINKLTSDEVYERLTKVLPIAETRAYVAKVTTRQARFEDIL